MNLDLDRESFIAWLRTQAPDAPAYAPVDPHACPIACYFGAQGAEYVFAGRWFVDVDDLRLQTPEWARLFMAWVDERDLSVNGGLVTARECLRFFDPGFVPGGTNN